MKTAQFQLHASIEDRHWWFVARRKILRDIIRQVLPPSKNHYVVEVGCGTGGNIAALAEDYTCLGTDTSEEAIDLARNRCPGVEFFHGEAPAAWENSRAREADLYLLADVLEHVPDDFLFLSEILAAVRPGAYILLTVPADMSLWTEHDRSFGHFRRYDLPRLKMTWDGLPVDELMLSYYNCTLYPAVKIFRTMSRLAGRAGGDAGTDFWVPPAIVNDTLRAIFARESRTLTNVLAGGRPRLSRGVSLIALLRRGDGPLTPRRKPAGLPPDLEPIHG
jgi:SAM-dependent methyltransferase